MRIFYINMALLRKDSEPAIWSRQLIYALSNAGSEVITFPKINDVEDDLSGQRDGLFLNLKRAIKARFSMKMFLFFLEYYMFFRGMTRTLLVASAILRMKNDIDADVVLARTYEYEWTPWLAARILRRPLVLEVHTPFYAERRLRGRGNSRLLQWAEGCQWRSAKRIWVNSEELRTILIGNRVRPERICVLHHAVRFEKFGPRSPLNDLNINRLVRVVFVGSFYPWHGMEPLLEAFSLARSKVAELHLTMIGDGIARPQTEKRARELGIMESVEFTGWLSNDTVTEYLIKCDIGVAPYVKLDPFFFDPVKVIEYMAAGLATIATDQGGLRETIEHGKTGLLVPPEDVAALTDALVTLAEDPYLVSSMGNAARAKVAEGYTWDRAAERLLELFSEALGQTEKRAIG